MQSIQYNLIRVNGIWLDNFIISISIYIREFFYKIHFRKEESTPFHFGFSAWLEAVCLAMAFNSDSLATLIIFAENVPYKVVCVVDVVSRRQMCVYGFYRIITPTRSSCDLNKHLTPQNFSIIRLSLYLSCHLLVRVFRYMAWQRRMIRRQTQRASQKKCFYDEYIYIYVHIQRFSVYSGID